jgi:hypothetical protein
MLKERDVDICFRHDAVLAPAFFLTTKVNTAGGQLPCRAYAVHSARYSEASQRRHTPVTITAADGCRIVKVQLNHLHQPTSPYVYTVRHRHLKTLGVWFEYP